MAKIVRRTDSDDLVAEARIQGRALGELYELYYEAEYDVISFFLRCQQKMQLV